MGEELKKARKEKGMTQKQLAALVGCDQREISRWECGREPGAKMLKRLAKALGVPMETLVADE